MGIGVERAALGIHRVVNAQMAEAMRLVSIGRGIDPRGYTLLPLGGAGPIHAAALAAELGIGRILVPPHPGVLSAAGLLDAPIEHEAAAAYPRALAGVDWREVRTRLAALDGECAALMHAEGVAEGAAAVSYSADLCYIGQGYHLEIAFGVDDADPLARLYRDFLAAHDRVYGHATEAPVRVVNLRSVHRVAPPIAPPPRAGPTASGAPVAKEVRPILVDLASGYETALVYDRAALAVGAMLAGPAILEQPDTTILVPRGWQCRAVAAGALFLERSGP